MEGRSGIMCQSIQRILKISRAQTDKGDGLGEPTRKTTCAQRKTHFSINPSRPNFHNNVNR
jgi:hypothetical protein